jgi:hypothetical protein
MRPFGGPQGGSQPCGHGLRRPFGVGAIGLGVVLIFTDLLPLSGTGTGVGAAVGGLTVLLTTAYGIREMRNAEKAEESEDAE